MKKLLHRRTDRLAWSFVLALLTLPLLPSQAQDVERRQVMYRIAATANLGDTLTVAVLRVGGANAPFTGSQGRALSVYQNGTDDRSGADDLGRAIVYAVNDSMTFVGVSLVDTTTAQGRLFAGDLIEVATDVPARDYRSIFFDLAISAIGFQDNERVLMFDQETVLREDSREFADALLDRMAADIRDTADQIRPMIPDNPEWDIQLESGRFAGQEMVDAMATTDARSVHAFLQFVRSFPGKYLGRDWKINETYATWLINAAPPGQEELRDSLLATTGTSRRNELLEAAADDLADNVFTTAWNSTAESWAKEGRIDDAYALSDLVADVAERLNDTSMRAHMLFSRANIAEENDDYEASVRYYTESVQLFRQVGDDTNESAAANNLGLALNHLDRYAEALEHFDGAIRIKTDELGTNPTSAQAFSLAGSYYGRGTSLSSMGRLEETAEAYERARTYYERSGTAAGLRNAANSQRRLGVAFRKLGRKDEATLAFERAAATYESLGDAEGKADVLDELAYLLSAAGEKQRALQTYRDAFDLHTESGDRKDAGYSMSQIGQVYWQLGDYDSAIASHLRAIEIRTAANDRSGRAYSWLQLAGLYKDTGDPTQAIAAYQQAAAIYEEIGDRSGQGDVLESLGDLYKREGDLPRATQIHRRALEIRQSIGARDAVATSLSDLADDYFDQQEYDSSWAYYEQSANLREEMGDRAGFARELSNLGLIAHFHRRDYEKSQEYYGDAIRIAGEVSSDADQAFSYAGLARVHDDAGDLQASLEAYQRALELYNSTDKKVTVLIGISDIHRARGAFEESRRVLGEAERLARDANSRHEIASILNAMGDIDRLTGDMESALSKARESLRIFQDVENPWGIANARIGLGNTLNQMGENKLAVREYEIADSLYGTVGSELSRGTPANNIGTIYYHQGQYDEALPYFERALKIQRDARIENEFTVIIVSNIGEVHVEAGRLKEAESWLLRAVELSEERGTDRIGVTAKSVLGRYYTKIGDFESAEASLVEARAQATRIGETVSTIDVLTKLGELYVETGRPAEARDVLSEAIQIASDVGYNRLLWRPLFLMGKVEISAGNQTAAIENLKQAIASVEDLRSKIFGSDAARKVFSSGERGDVYEALIDLLIRRGEVEEALSYVERSHNEELRRQLSDLNVEFADPAQAETYREGKELRSRLSQLEQRVAAQKASPDADQRRDLIDRLEEMVSVAETEYNAFVNVTLKGNEELTRHFNSQSASQFFRSKDRIPPDAAVVAYLLGKSKLYIFVATREAVTARVLDVGRTEIAKLVRNVYDSISVGPNSGKRRGVRAARPGGTQTSLDKEDLKSLYQILIGPIEAEVYRKNSIAVMPSGHLYLLPFQLLTRTGESRDAIVRTHTVYYISDLDVFANDSNDDDVKVVAFGNADSSLPNAEIEVRDIADLFDGTQVYIREEATEQRAKDAPAAFNVLHLATHGTLDFNNFQNSYLTLASTPEAGDDGRLTLGEIWGLSSLQNYRLVTLSACRSAVNDNVEDGWPVSPATAFFDVGVSTVVASLWEVDDTATSLLMREFYGNLAAMGAAKALREAQATLMSTAEFADPYYWAPFVVTGDWR